MPFILDLVVLDEVVLHLVLGQVILILTLYLVACVQVVLVLALYAVILGQDVLVLGQVSLYRYSLARSDSSLALCSLSSSLTQSSPVRSS